MSQTLIRFRTSTEGQASDVDWPALFAGVPGARPVSLAADDVLFREGERAEAVFAVLGGKLIVEHDEPDGEQSVVAFLEGGDLVGELVVWTGQPHSATVRAVADTRLLQLSTVEYRQLLQRDPVLRAAAAALILPRVRQNQLMAVLRRVFGRLDAPLVEFLQRRLVWRWFTAGQIVFRQGEPGESVMLIVNGRVRLRRRDRFGEERETGDAGPGDVVGSAALLSDAPQAFTVVAVRETNTAELPREAFDELAARYPQHILSMMRAIVGRDLSPALEGRERPPRAATFALVPVTPEVDLEALSASLSTALERQGSTLALDRARFEALFGQKGAADAPSDHPAHPILANWMNSLEEAHDFIVYVADPTWSVWTRRCIYQADRILLVANAALPVKPGLLEEAIATLHLPSRTELVLLHAKGVDQPHNTAAWLAHRHVTAHHHVRLGTTSHVERLARRLTGNAVGLVLAGGGARGYVHLGVYRAMEELGIEADLFGGTSMGALLAAAIALDMDYRAVLDLSRELANPKALFDYTLPFVSLFSSEKVTQMLQRAAMGRAIEDLWRPYFAVSANVSRAEVNVHHTGPVWRAVRASIAIPGVFAPVQDDNGDVLVDGGVMNNFPVDIMRGLIEGGQIIGVRPEQRVERSRQYNFGPAVSGWQVLWSKVNPRGEPMQVPALMSLLIRSATLNSDYLTRLARQQSDVLIEPDISPYGTLEFEKYAEIIEVGHREARPKLEAWLNERASHS